MKIDPSLTVILNFIDRREEKMEDIKRDLTTIIQPKNNEEKPNLVEYKPHNPQRLQNVAEASEFDVPDGGYGWVIVAASFLAITVVDGVINSFGIFLSELVKEFVESEGKIAWVGSILAGVTLLVGPLAGALTNKFGCRTTCIIGSLLTSAALGVSVLCQTVTLLMVTYFVAGIGLGLILLPSVVFVGYYFKSKRALATGIALSGSGFGTVIFPPIINYIIHIGGWKVANLSLAASALTCTLFGALMKPMKSKTVLSDIENHFPVKILSKSEESKSAIDVSFSNMVECKLYKPRNTCGLQAENLGETRNRSQSNVAEYYSFQRRNLGITRKEIFYSGSLMQLNIPRQKNSTSSSKDNLKSLLDLTLLKDQQFLLFGIVNIFAMISFYIPLVYIVDYAKTKNIEPGQASFLISVIGIVNTVGRIVFGYIVNFPTIDSIFVNNICLLIGAVAFGLTPYCYNYLGYIFASLLFGVSIAAYSSLTPIILVDLLGIERLTNGFGIIQLFRGVTTLLGTPMAGILHDWTHTYSVPFFVGGGLFLISITFGFILQYSQRKPVIIETESVT